MVWEEEMWLTILMYRIVRPSPGLMDRQEVVVLMVLDLAVVDLPVASPVAQVLDPVPVPPRARSSSFPTYVPSETSQMKQITLTRNSFPIQSAGRTSRTSSDRLVSDIFIASAVP